MNPFVSQGLRKWRPYRLPALATVLASMTAAFLLIGPQPPFQSTGLVVYLIDLPALTLDGAWWTAATVWFVILTAVSLALGLSAWNRERSLNALDAIASAGYPPRLEVVGPWTAGMRILADIWTLGLVLLAIVPLVPVISMPTGTTCMGWAISSGTFWGEYPPVLWRAIVLWLFAAAWCGVLLAAGLRIAVVSRGPLDTVFRFVLATCGATLASIAIASPLHAIRYGFEPAGFVSLVPSPLTPFHLLYWPWFAVLVIPSWIALCLLLLRTTARRLAGDSPLLARVG